MHFSVFQVRMVPIFFEQMAPPLLQAHANSSMLRLRDVYPDSWIKDPATKKGGGFLSFFVSVNFTKL